MRYGTTQRFLQNTTTFSPWLTLCVWRWYLLCTEDRSKPQRKKNYLIREKMQLFGVTQLLSLISWQWNCNQFLRLEHLDQNAKAKKMPSTFSSCFDPWVTEALGGNFSCSSFGFWFPGLCFTHNVYIPGGQQHGQVKDPSKNISTASASASPPAALREASDGRCCFSWDFTSSQRWRKIMFYGVQYRMFTYRVSYIQHQIS